MTTSDDALAGADRGLIVAAYGKRPDRSRQTLTDQDRSRNPGAVGQRTARRLFGCKARNTPTCLRRRAAISAAAPAAKCANARR